MNNKKRLVSAGSCPLCGGELHYGNSENNGDTISYNWKCFNCDKTGIEFHTITFSEHYININNQDCYFTKGSEIGNSDNEQ